MELVKIAELMIVMKNQLDGLNVLFVWSGFIFCALTMSENMLVEYCPKIIIFCVQSVRVEESNKHFFRKFDIFYTV